MNTNGKQYIGSAKDLYLRLNEHLSCGARKKSNSALQSAIFKYSLNTLAFVYMNIFLRAEQENKQTSDKLLTDL
jgi:predicted GIY-YIG superfamily endonuclease